MKNLPLRSQAFLALLVALVPACSSSDAAPPANPTGKTTNDLKWETIVTGDWTLDPGVEDYYCVRQTMTEDVWISGFRPIAPLGTHHSVLGIAEPGFNLGEDGLTKCAANEVGAQMLQGSGVGTEPVMFPEGVAVKIAAGKQLILNLHLYNSSDEPISGTSGVEIVRADPADGTKEAQLVLAGTFNLNIPPGRVEQTGTCTLPTDVTLFSVLPHMHKRGVHLSAQAVPADGSDPVPLSDRDYSFEEQKYYPVAPALTLEHGSRLEVTCTYENTGSSTISFGQSSDAEMCFLGTYMYPATFPSPYCVDMPGAAQCGKDPEGPGVQVLASGLPNPATLAIDGTSIYWVNNSPNGSVMKMPLAGGSPTTLASSQPGPWGIAVDAANVYWTNFSGNEVVKVAIGGGIPEKLATGLQFGPNSIATDGSHVYWTAYGNDGGIMKLPVAGGTPTDLATGQATPDTIALDGSNAYWTNTGGGTIVKVPLAGGTPETLASEQQGPQGIVVDSTNVFWINHNNGSVATVPIAGGTAKTLYTGKTATLYDWSGIAVDATNVYWATNDGEMKRVPKTGGADTTIATGMQRPGNIVSDGTSLYFTTYCGSLVKLTP